MGLDLERFDDKENIIEDLKCMICFDVLENPIQSQCEHSFCDACIKGWLDQGHKTCPTDRRQLTHETLKPPSRITRQLLDKLNIRCKYYAEGCRLMSKVEDMSYLIDHELNHCNVVKNEEIRKIEIEIEKFREEIDELKTKISEKEEESLSDYLINQQESTEKENTIIRLTKTIEENNQRNKKLWKIIQETAEQGLTAEARTLSLTRRTFDFASSTAPSAPFESDTKGNGISPYDKYRWYKLTIQIIINVTIFFLMLLTTH